jgi:hypothetical protein
MSDEKIIEHIPFLMNLGQSEEIIGWTDIYRMPDGNVRLDVRLGPNGSDLVNHFVEIAEVKGIGFAGVIRRPEDRASAHRLYGGGFEKPAREKGPAD